MIKGKPVSAETIHINHPEASYGIFCFNEQGDLFLNSDYGMYGYAWRSYGPEPFRDFLAGLNVDYLVNKLDHCYINGAGRGKGIPKFAKEKLIILCAEFIKVLKETKPAVKPQELITSLENLVTEFSRPDWEIWCDHSVGICACGVIKLLEDARETLKKAKS
jgi:hypothetical protein